MTPIAYLDWNVFNRIEQKNSSDPTLRGTYEEIENLILMGKIITPYSNGHINDLLRGHHKNPVYIPGHIETLGRLSKNICITQYWGLNKVIWHYREPLEFFNAALDDLSLVNKRFTELRLWPGLGSYGYPVQGIGTKSATR